MKTIFEVQNINIDEARVAFNLSWRAISQQDIGKPQTDAFRLKSYTRHYNKWDKTDFYFTVEDGVTKLFLVCGNGGNSVRYYTERHLPDVILLRRDDITEDDIASGAEPRRKVTKSNDKLASVVTTLHFNSYKYPKSYEHRKDEYRESMELNERVRDWMIANEISHRITRHNENRVDWVRFCFFRDGDMALFVAEFRDIVRTA